MQIRQKPTEPGDLTTSLDLAESAAVKIQAGFRGYRVRKQLNEHKSNKHQRRAHKMAAEKSSPGAATELKSAPQSPQSDSSSSLEDRSAAVIQAGVRGFLVRKKQKAATDAAIKIQASFRGFKARKETQQLKQKAAN